MLDLDHLKELAQALAANPLRTLLTVFGVFWGIFMLVLLLGSGKGLENGALSSFTDAASNSVFVWTQRTSKPYHGLGTGRSPRLTDEDTEAVRSGVPEAQVVAPRHQLGGFGSGNNVTRGTKSGGFSVMGDVPEVLRIDLIAITRGRFLDPLDVSERRKVAVIGPRVQEVLFARGEDPIGQTISIKGVYFQVVGVFKTFQTGEEAERKAQTIYVPLPTFQRAFNMGNRIGWFALTAREGARAAQVEEKVLQLLRVRHQVAPDDARAFGHYNVEEEYLRLMGLFSGIRALVWIVGVGTLAAGVIGVSNIMLVIVKERTKELGIRRAIGATPAWIIRGIVLESFLLTASAGYLGLLAGMGTLGGVRSLLTASGGTQMFADPDVGPATALRALSVLVAAGVLAGVLPAQRAIGVRTVDALRAE